jgi:hypothetical protein
MDLMADVALPACIWCGRDHHGRQCPREPRNACGDDGLVHSCELVPLVHEGCTTAARAGFTWCMIFFTWKDEPRFHPPEDGAESRLERTAAHVTCFKCIAGEMGTGPSALL